MVDLFLRVPNGRKLELDILFYLRKDLVFQSFFEFFDNLFLHFFFARNQNVPVRKVELISSLEMGLQDSLDVLLDFGRNHCFYLLVKNVLLFLENGLDHFLDLLLKQFRKCLFHCFTDLCFDLNLDFFL